MWQDYETHLFTCPNCNTQSLGKKLIHDFEDSESVLSLDCPACKFRVALLNIQATKQEIAVFAELGFKTAIAQQEKLNERWYESYPDFTKGLTPEELIERAAYAIEFMAVPNLGRPAIQLMDMLAFGIRLATNETPYICELSEEDRNADYFQVIRGEQSEYFAEISSPESLGKSADQAKAAVLEARGWLAPDNESPNFHRIFMQDSSPMSIAAVASQSLHKTF